MNDARKAQAPVTASLSRPHTLFHEAVLGRTVKRLAFRAHRFASAGVPRALLHETHLGSAVKRLAVRTHRLAVAGLREAGNQHRYNNTPHFNLLCSQLRRGRRSLTLRTGVEILSLRRMEGPLVVIAGHSLIAD